MKTPNINTLAQLTDRWDAERIYTQYHALAINIALKYYKKYGRPFIVVREMALDILVDLAVQWNDPEYYRKYDNTKAKEVTWIGFCLKHELDDRLDFRRLGLKEKNKRLTDYAKYLENRKPCSLQNLVDRLISELSTDAMEIVKAILAVPEDLMNGIKPNNTIQFKAVVNRARYAALSHIAEAGWDYLRFQRAWNEIKEAV